MEEGRKEGGRKVLEGQQPVQVVQRNARVLRQRDGVDKGEAFPEAGQNPEVRAAALPHLVFQPWQRPVEYEPGPTPCVPVSLGPPQFQTPIPVLLVGRGSIKFLT